MIMEYLDIYRVAGLIVLSLFATTVIGFGAFELGRWFAKFMDEGGGDE